MIWYKAEQMELERGLQRPENDPSWNRRINNSIKELRTTIGRQETRESLEGKTRRREMRRQERNKKLSMGLKRKEKEERVIYEI